MDSFGARGELGVGNDRFEIFRLAALEADFGVSRLPYSLKVLLENLLRHEGSPSVSTEDVAMLAGGQMDGGLHEIAFSPARILLQDFTGVPAVVDLAALRDAVGDLGGDPVSVNPRVPAELVIDHSVVVDAYGTRSAFARNVELEFARNEERYRFLRWGQQALSGLRVVPPGRGICHQVNLEYLARVVFVDDAGVAYPDTLLGTDSHTPMVNGLGVVGWGVGGIEAEAAMLGQPSSMLVPSVVGFRLTGTLPEGTTATDLVLTVTEMLRRHGVVGKFVEFYGPGVENVSVENRATIGNMSPEYGSTVTMFPIDAETLRYLTFTGRPPALVQLVEAYAKEQGLWHDPVATPIFSETLELDLSTVVASIAGPARPQDRVALDRAKATFRAVLADSLPASSQRDEPSDLEGLPPHVAPGSVEAASAESFPASDPPTAVEGDPDPDGEGAEAPAVVGMPDRPRKAVPVRMRGGAGFDLDHGHVVIAAITSCTNTSNPSVMLAAGLVAKKAVELGLGVKPWVKTSLAPGSRVVVEYYERTGLLPFLEELGFHVVGFGCTTCIGNSGPLAPEISRAIATEGVAVASVLSGNRNFEGRIHPEVRLNYLMSPPLVVAYALAGTMDIDLRHEPFGPGRDGRPVYLRDLWPTDAEVAATAATALRPEMFGRAYGAVFAGDERWEGLDVPGGERYGWDPRSTYVRKPPFLGGLTRQPAPVADIADARALVVLGDGVTTDHISPAGAIHAGGPAGEWLTAEGVAPGDFNSYGARRGNDEVMIRGTFANVRLRNRLAPRTEGGVTVHLPDGEPMTIYDAAERYRQEGVALVVLAGKQYGSGSSRDWAAKGTALLGIRAVLAESFERIHRSNLLQMGVLPLQFRPGESVETLGLSGHEAYTIMGLGGPRLPREVKVRADDLEFGATVRIDTPMEAEHYRHGGILPYVARSLAP